MTTPRSSPLCPVAAGFGEVVGVEDEDAVGEAGDVGIVVGLAFGRVDGGEGGGEEAFFEGVAAAGEVGDFEEDLGYVGGDNPVGVVIVDVALIAGGDGGEELGEQVAVADGLCVDGYAGLDFSEGLGGPGEDAVHAVPVLVPDGDFGFELIGHVVCHVTAGHVAGDGCAGGQHGAGGCG